jgi:glycosyltransferase involved in cell wall biosynthesis
MLDFQVGERSGGFIPGGHCVNQEVNTLQPVRFERDQTGTNVKPRIVLSGVNLTEMGPLAVFRDALDSVAAEHGKYYEIIALVHRRDLFDTQDVTYLEFPNVKSSWLRRLHFEYRYLKGLSLQLRPVVWLSMHDMTPNVSAEIRSVYCHNPSPFYRFHLSEAVLDWKFGLFTVFYSLLYRINIHANDFVIVQQDWIRKQFSRRYDVHNIVVAHPAVQIPDVSQVCEPREPGAPYRFFYPAFPRTFKNPEVCLEASRILERRGFRRFEVWLTFDATVNRHAAAIVKKFSDVVAVHWLGVLPRNRVFQLYREADCLLFPSKLETWGMPITEFRFLSKPILAADLPYAHETAAGYRQVAFFNPDDPEQLAELMEQAATGQPVFEVAPEVVIDNPFVRNWSELWALLLQNCPR